MNTAEVLRAARALISTPEKWIQNTYARDASGEVVHRLDPSAVAFCATGAIARAGNFNTPTETRAWGLLQKAVGGQVVSSWNDESTHAEVLAAFDKAIILAEQGVTP